MPTFDEVLCARAANRRDRRRRLRRWALLRRWWWRLWTGFGSLAAKRRAIEHDVVRFGGTVTWRNDG